MPRAASPPRRPGDQSAFYIPDELEDEIDAVCEHVISSESRAEAVSRQSARKAFTDCIASVARDGAPTATVGKVEDTIAAIRAKVRPTTVYVPLPGLRLAVPSVRLGRVMLSTWRRN